MRVPFVFCGALLALVGLRHRRIVDYRRLPKCQARHSHCFGRFHSVKTILNCFRLRYHSSQRDNHDLRSITKMLSFCWAFFIISLRTVGEGLAPPAFTTSVKHKNLCRERSESQINIIFICSRRDRRPRLSVYKYTSLYFCGEICLIYTPTYQKLGVA